MATVSTHFSLNDGRSITDTRHVDVDNATGPDGQVFFFPYEPQRRSVKYWDAYGQVTGILDYTGPGEGQSMASPETYVFAGEFAQPAEPGEHAYQARRTVEVDAKTGRVVDMTWERDGTTDRLTEDTRAALAEPVEREHRLLKALQVLAIAMRLVALIALAWGVVLFARRR